MYRRRQARDIADCSQAPFTPVEQDAEHDPALRSRGARTDKRASYSIDGLQSQSVEIRPTDSRCKYWAKIVRANQPLPFPLDVNGANDLPVPYLRRGDEELAPGDALFEGEAVHHSKNRGWLNSLHWVDADGKLHVFRQPFSDYKAQLKAQGLAVELLKGAGDVAAMVRIVHGLRGGLKLEENA